MAQVLKQEKSLMKSAKKWWWIGFGLLIFVAICIYFDFKVIGTVALVISFSLFPVMDRYFKGSDGEWAVTKQLRDRLGDDWYLINDIVINDGQIDHVLIGPGGIFTIETKNYKGKIYGSEHAKEWTNYLGRNKYKFYNPVLQGKTHSVKLANFLKEKGIDCYVKTIVVFAGSAKLKVTTTQVPVLTPYKIVDYINSQRVDCSEDIIKQMVELVMREVGVNSVEN